MVQQDIAALEQVTVQSRLQGLDSTYAVIRRAALEGPEKTAIYFLREGNAQEAPVMISYAKLFSRVTQTANLFHDLGLGTRDVVSYILPNLPQTHYILWGGEAAGIANPINPLLDVDHIAGIMNAAQSMILVTMGPNAQSDLWSKVKNIKDRVPSLKYIIQVMSQNDQNAQEANILQYEDIIDQFNGETLDSGRIFDKDDICSLFHTGGTTGTPKMARHSHHNEISNSMMVGLAMGVSSDDVGFCGLPLFHVNAAIITGLACFLERAEIILATPAGFRTPGSLSNFWQIVEKYRVTFFSAVPTIYSGLLQVPVGDADLSSLRVAICGAAPMPSELIRKFEKATGLILIEGYGMTEGTCVSSCNPLHGERRAGSVGFRLPYQQLKTMILDGDGHYVRDCKIDEIGSVAIKGPNVFSGYLDPSDNVGIWAQEGWFNSGDMGRLDEQGYLWLTGRTKELIIRSGHNIDPAVIENALNKHDVVMAAAAVGRPDIYAGELPVAYVVLKPDTTCDAAELMDFAAENISERGAVPKEIYLVDALPLTAVGKIFKPALKQDIIKRVIQDALGDLGLLFTISVEPDKSYGTVAFIEVDSSAGEEKIDSMKHILDQYIFHTKISKKDLKKQG
ncbi:MAG: acyl-CoA synthetase [Emcibacter sp.]|nr:acyl-CoA synthetase [Emcibacter sp.]